MIDAIDHVIIAVRDLDAAQVTYTRILGRSPSWHGTHPGLGSANILYRLDRMYLELVAPVGEGPFADRLRAKLDETGEGLMGLVFATRDAAACAETLRSRGVRASDPMAAEGTDSRTGAVRKWRSTFIPADSANGLFVFIIEHLSGPDALPMAPLVSADSEDAAVFGVDHVVVDTPDPDGAIGFFGDKLGLRLALDQTVEKWGVRQLFFRVGGVTLEVVSGLNRKGAPAKQASLWGIAYKVKNIEAARARLEGAGADVSEVRIGRKPGTHVATIRPETHGIPTLLISTEKVTA